MLQCTSLVYCRHKHKHLTDCLFGNSLTPLSVRFRVVVLSYRFVFKNHFLSDERLEIYFHRSLGYYSEIQIFQIRFWNETCFLFFCCFGSDTISVAISLSSCEVMWLTNAELSALHRVKRKTLPVFHTRKTNQ